MGRSVSVRFSSGRAPLAGIASLKTVCAVRPRARGDWRPCPRSLLTLSAFDIDTSFRRAFLTALAAMNVPIATKGHLPDVVIDGQNGAFEGEDYAAAIR